LGFSSTQLPLLLNELANPANPKNGVVCGKNGVVDRNIVADVFFGKAEPGVTPKFTTADKGIYNSLARRAGINFNNLGSKTLPEAYPKGFDVIINGRTIRVFPLPRR
jgi:hypothetical protein